MLGPRLGKYGPDGKPRTLAAHNIPMAGLGVFILLFGWFGFNAASTFAATDVRFAVVATNTAIAGCVRFGHRDVLGDARGFKKPDPGMMMNGMLAGLVAITAPCAFVQPWAAAVIGAIAAVIVIESIIFIEKKGIDDPVGAISVHGIGGIFGVLCVGIFSDGRYGALWNAHGERRTPAGKGVTGILYGTDGAFLGSGSFGELGFGQLASQVIGALVIIFVMGAVRVGVLQAPEHVHQGRRSAPTEADEIAGLDRPEMGVLAYDNLQSGRSTSSASTRAGHRCWRPAASHPTRRPGGSSRSSSRGGVGAGGCPPAGRRRPSRARNIARDGRETAGR